MNEKLKAYDEGGLAALDAFEAAIKIKREWSTRDLIRLLAVRREKIRNPSGVTQ